jgi:hypothetical protein
MPWTARSAPKTVRGSKKRHAWAVIANACLHAGKPEGQCKRTASGVLKKQRTKKR